jgi:hypothetical protein
MARSPAPHRTCAFLIALLLLCVAAAADAKECKKGKKLCGGKCISAKKVCKEAGGEEAAAAVPAASECKKGKKLCGGKCIPAKKVCKEAEGVAVPQARMESASTALVDAALASPAGQAMLQLARVLQQSGDLDVTDKQRDAFRRSVAGLKAPQPICDISHIQLVRDCDTKLKSKVTLPCYLAVDEMAAVCEGRFGKKMPPVK